MSKCTNCLSEKVCRYKDRHNLKCKNDYVCPYFTDRSEWVHLPCKVGTAVYIPEIEVDKIERKFVTKIYRTSVYEYSVNARYIMYYTRKGNNFTDSMLGKTVFLTREEATKALEENK